ncbi:hypothetical protein D3C76_999670 [compost metagenome]
MNEIRAKIGVPETSFTLVSQDNYFQATNYNDVRTSIGKINPPISIPVMHVTDDFVYASDINKLRDSLNSVLTGHGIAEAWSFSTGSYSFSDFALDSLGNIYLTYYSDSSLLTGLRKFDSSGNELWVRYINCRSITIDSSDNLYISGNNFIKKLDPNGNEIWTNSEINVRTADIAIDSFDNVYVVHPYSSTSLYKSIRKLDTNGNEVWFSSEDGFPFVVAIDTYSNILVGSNRSIKKLDPNGNEIWSISDINFVCSVAIDLSGNVYIATRRSIIKTDTNGNEIWTINVRYSTENQIVADLSSNIYLNDGIQLIHKFDSNGNEIWRKSFDYSNKKIAFDSLGTLYTAYEIYERTSITKYIEY